MLLAYFNLIYCWTYNNCQNKSLVKANKAPLYLREQCCWKILAALCVAGINFKPPLPKNPKQTGILPCKCIFFGTSSYRVSESSVSPSLHSLILVCQLWSAGFQVSTHYLYTRKAHNFYTVTFPQPFPNQNWAVPSSLLIQVMPFQTLHPWGHRTAVDTPTSISSGSLSSAAPPASFSAQPPLHQHLQLLPPSLIAYSPLIWTTLQATSRWKKHRPT